MAGERVERRLSAIFASDVVGYSRLMEADEEGTLARDYEFHPETSEALIEVAMIHLMLRRLAKGGEPNACPC